MNYIMSLSEIHIYAIKNQECSRVRYEDNSIIFDIQTRKDKLRRAYCQSKHIILSGSHDRFIRSVPIGTKSVLLEMRYSIFSYYFPLHALFILYFPENYLPSSSWSK